MTGASAVAGDAPVSVFMAANPVLDPNQVLQNRSA
jgi:hypothetical protein